VNLTLFDDAHLPELMSWFPDELSCHTWGGPEFRFPFTEATFREDARLASLSTWALVGDDGTLAGFGQFYLRVGRCHLGRLAIAPDARGRGLGATLVRGLCRHGGAALGVGTFSLFVVPGNERALRLYRRLGFSPAPYPEPDPALDPYIYMVAMPPAQATLRQAVRADVREIQRVRHAVRENRLVSMVITDDEVIAAIEQTGRGWVVEDDGRIVAFAIGNAVNGNIWALFVESGYEGRGHGRRLHDVMVNWLWSCGLKRLWLTTGQKTRAQRFYERAGWQNGGIQPNGEILFERQAP